MADTPAGSAHQFERDLRAIREARGVDLAEVQQETRIPADVLDRFEMGRLVGDPHYNEVYLKNLLRAYAAAVGLPPLEVVTAYEAVKQGSYRSDLRRYLGGSDSPPPPPPEPSPPSPPAPATDASAADSPSEPAREPPSEPPSPPEAGVSPPSSAAAAPPAVAALRAADRQAKPPPPVPKHEPKVRVRSRESVTSSTSGIESSWGIIIGGTVVALLVIGGALWLMIRPDQPDIVEPANQVVAVPEEEVEEDPEEAPPPGDTPQLQVPIQVTLIAEGGPLGGADGFRVTEEPDVRRPYWLEQGEEQTFSSDSLVIIWGHETAGQFGVPPEARLRLQEYTWDPAPGAVLRIDRQRGQALLDSLHRAQARPGS